MYYYHNVCKVREATLPSRMLAHAGMNLQVDLRTQAGLALHVSTGHKNNCARRSY